MSASSITTDLASANSHLDSVDTIIAGWISSYVLGEGAGTTFNGSGFASDGGNAAAALVNRLRTTVRNLNQINHG
jgi:hypothetical protein